MEFNKHKHANNERYLSQQPNGKPFIIDGPETFVELIRVKKATRQMGRHSDSRTDIERNRRFNKRLGQK